MRVSAHAQIVALPRENIGKSPSCWLPCSKTPRKLTVRLVKMALRYTASDVAQLVDDDNFGLSESDNSDFEGDEVFGYLPELQQDADYPEDCRDSDDEVNAHPSSEAMVSDDFSASGKLIV